MATKKLQSDKAVLLILDGWGLGRLDNGNAIYLAKTPFIDSLYQKYPWTSLCASGACVGLPSQQVGNSEAGHMNLGAGRVVDQDIIKISKQINTGQFFKNAAFVMAIKNAKKKGAALHLMGLLSNGQSPHSDPDHLLSLLTLARNLHVKKVYLHLFTDGRDSPPRSSLKAVEALERFLRPNEVIATIIGRFYAMDRKKSWERTAWAYDAMTVGRGYKSNSPQEGITRAYNADVTDEFIEPVVIYRRGKMVPRIKDGDSVIFFNLRSDRARQLAKPFVQPLFEKKNPGASRRKEVLQNLVFVAMTDFGPDLSGILTAYPSADVQDALPLVLKGKKQLYVAESEKYAHVTFFFNGGYDHALAGEDWVNISSPMVKSYAQTPAMSTAKIAAKIISGLKKYDFICANFAAPDMVGHTGDLAAGIKAAEAVDKYVKMVTAAVLKANGVLLLTADHGNLESMLNPKTGEIITEHTTNPVPFFLVKKGLGKRTRLKPSGSLGNVAPTVAKVLNCEKSKLMTKSSLI